VASQVPSDYGKPHQGRLTAFGKELPPTEARLGGVKFVPIGVIDSTTAHHTYLVLDVNGPIAREA